MTATTTEKLPPKPRLSPNNAEWRYICERAAKFSRVTGHWLEPKDLLTGAFRQMVRPGGF
jgi:hypothetical protein